MTKDLKKILKISSFSIFFIVILTIAFLGSKDLILGVKIKKVDIVNIMDGTSTPGKIMRITGNAKNAKDLTLDGREISINQEGTFDETIALIPGYNIIDIKAVDKFGKSDEKIYKLMLQ